MLLVTTNMLGYAVQIFTGLFVFVCILFLTYIATKYIAKKSSFAMKSKHLKVIESISLGMDKTIFLVQAGDKKMLIGVCGKNMQFLSEITLTDVEIEKQDNGVKTMNFSKVLTKYLHKDSVHKKTVNSNVASNVDKIRQSFNMFKKNKQAGEENSDEEK